MTSAISWAIFTLVVAIFYGIYRLFEWGMELSFRYSAIPPKVGWIEFKPNGMFLYNRLVTHAMVGSQREEWKGKHDDPNKIAVNVKAHGWGRSTPASINDDDYREFKWKSGGKTMVVTGLKYFNKAVAMQLKLLTEDKNHLAAEASNWKNKYLDLEANYEKKLEEMQERQKKGIIILGGKNPPKKK